jgi:hypothetical protein
MCERWNEDDVINRVAWISLVLWYGRLPRFCRRLLVPEDAITQECIQHRLEAWMPYR